MIDDLVAWRAAVVVLLILCACLAGVAKLTLDTITVLLATNAALLEAQAAPHVAHDANLTAWRNADSSITVWVDGRFPHRIDNACEDVGRF